MPPLYALQAIYTRHFFAVRALWSMSMSGQPEGKNLRLPPFRVTGDAGKWGKFQIDAGWFSFAVAQKFRQAGAEPEGMWESLGVYCTQELDGELVIRVIVFNKDWDSPLQIARIASRPEDGEELLTPIGFNLNHVAARDLG